MSHVVCVIHDHITSWLMLYWDSPYGNGSEGRRGKKLKSLILFITKGMGHFGSRQQERWEWGWLEESFERICVCVCGCIHVYTVPCVCIFVLLITRCYHLTTSLFICLKPLTVSQLFVVSIWNLFFSLLSLSLTHTHTHTQTHTDTESYFPFVKTCKSAQRPTNYICHLHNKLSVSLLLFLSRLSPLPPPFISSLFILLFSYSDSSRTMTYFYQYVTLNTENTLIWLSSVPTSKRSSMVFTIGGQQWHMEEMTNLLNWPPLTWC